MMRPRYESAGVVTLHVMCIACSAVVGPDAPAAPAALFDQVWHDLDLHYSFFIIKHINWDSLGAVYRPRAAAAPDDNALAPILTGLLGNLHDDHIELFINGNEYNTSSSPYPNLFDPTVTFEKYVQSVGGFPSGLEYGLVTPSVGYMRFQAFADDTLPAQLDTALAALGTATALIIDVRHNGGGLVDVATGVAARFAEHATTAAYVRYRDGPAHSDFSASIAQMVSPAGARQFRRNVYILTDRNTYSAAELFILEMRALGHTTVVGDTTGGEAGSPFARELQNGWGYQFPESIEYTLDGQIFEGTGLPPDVPVQNTLAEIDRLVDAQLERTIALATSGN